MANYIAKTTLLSQHLPIKPIDLFALIGELVEGWNRELVFNNRLWEYYHNCKMDGLDAELSPDYIHTNCRDVVTSKYSDKVLMIRAFVKNDGLRAGLGKWEYIPVTTAFVMTQPMIGKTLVTIESRDIAPHGELFKTDPFIHKMLCELPNQILKELGIPPIMTAQPTTSGDNAADEQATQSTNALAASERGVVVGGNLSGSIVVTGDNPTIVFKQATKKISL
jgi:hypothetical protein